MFKIATIIPTFNRKNSLLHLLDIIFTQKANDIELSIIVVADGSTDGTQEAVRLNFPGVSIIEGNGNWWWTKSINKGCNLAIKNKIDAVLLLNDDIELHTDFFSHLYKAHLSNPLAVIGSLNLTRETPSRVFFSGASKLRWWDGKLIRYHSFLSPYEPVFSGLHPSIVLPGRGLFIPVDVFTKIGFFDEKNLPQYKADYDFVFRANEKEIPCLISWDTIIYNDVSSTGKGATFTHGNFFKFLKSLFEKHSRTNLRTNFIYYKRHYPFSALLLFPFTAIIISLRQVVSFFKDRKY